MADDSNRGGGESKNGASPPRQGYRKDGAPYKDGNTRGDGGYETGRNRPPEGGKFRPGDGRKRGRRAKGVQNADSEFAKELNRKISIREGGVVRKVTKGHAIDLKLIENAAVAGDNRAIELVDKRRQRITEKQEAASRYHTQNDYEILMTFLRERSDELGIDPGLLGDPEGQE